MVVFYGTLYKMYATVPVYTEKVTFSKVPEKHDHDQLVTLYNDYPVEQKYLEFYFCKCLHLFRLFVQLFFLQEFQAFLMERHKRV